MRDDHDDLLGALVQLLQIRLRACNKTVALELVLRAGGRDLVRVDGVDGGEVDLRVLSRDDGDRRARVTRLGRVLLPAGVGDGFDVFGEEGTEGQDRGLAGAAHGGGHDEPDVRGEVRGEFLFEGFGELAALEAA